MATFSSAGHTAASTASRRGVSHAAAIPGCRRAAAGGAWRARRAGPRRGRRTSPRSTGSRPRRGTGGRGGVRLLHETADGEGRRGTLDPQRQAGLDVAEGGGRPIGLDADRDDVPLAGRRHRLADHRGERGLVRTTWSAAERADHRPRPPALDDGRRGARSPPSSRAATARRAGRPRRGRAACSVTAAACAAPVTTRAPCGPVSGSSRSRVCWSRLRPLPVRSSRNFGCPARESGHEPRPGAPGGDDRDEVGQGRGHPSHRSGHRLRRSAFVQPSPGDRRLRESSLVEGRVTQSRLDCVTPAPPRRAGSLATN